MSVLGPTAVMGRDTTNSMISVIVDVR